MSSALEIGARQILSWPNMDLMRKKQNLSFLNFEHTTFLPINRVLALLEATGFKVLETTYFKDHSIFIASEKVAGLKHLDVVGEPQLHEFSNYFETLSAQVKLLNQAIREFEGNVYLFGAHIFSQMLISAGLDINKIEFVLDNAVHKQGKRLYGTSLKVESPEFLRENIKRDHESLVIAAVGEYFEEIQQQLFEISSSIKVLGMR